MGASKCRVWPVRSASVGSSEESGLERGRHATSRNAERCWPTQARPARGAECGHEHGIMLQARFPVQPDPPQTYKLVGK
ncbi:hypothetical protein MA16_Dca017516 [Dendrobium catenatum]|uniref:Uncharacterized protein n=1 Tax=Dendrobium catenatum TaxID=906689 RepID=A0A2I0X3V4_9ASPA|nr:hypothetical protein MA16_Dca017516 [Dendrobium catenatum]